MDADQPGTFDIVHYRLNPGPLTLVTSRASEDQPWVEVGELVSEGRSHFFVLWADHERNPDRLHEIGSCAQWIPQHRSTVDVCIHLVLGSAGPTTTSPGEDYQCVNRYLLSCR